MKLAVLSESSADEAAVRILTEGILGRQTASISGPPIKSRGWPSVREVLPSLIKHLHYRTDAEGLILVIDSNHSPIHQLAHDLAPGAHNDCRLCQLSSIVDHVQSSLRSVHGRTRVKIAIGLAVPCIEAWYLCGLDPQVSEAAWARNLGSRQFPYSGRELKRRVYGTDRPSLSLETERARAEAQRLARNCEVLESDFPNGFGALVRRLRTWK
jgi:hypothetical protein